MGGSSGPGARMDDGRPEVSEAKESVNAEVDNNLENAVLVDMTLASPDCDWPAISTIMFPRDWIFLLILVRTRRRQEHQSCPPMRKMAHCCGVTCNFFDFIVVLEGLPVQALEGCFLLGGVSL